MNIAVIGLGYVGLPLLLCGDSFNNKIIGIDSNQSRLEALQKGELYIKDSILETKLLYKNLYLTNSLVEGIKKAEIVFVCVPTNWDEKNKKLDTSVVENIITEGTRINPKAIFVIKSTVPFGFTKKLCLKLKTENILFSPEFLREGHAGADTLFPSRIIVGTNSDNLELANNILNYLTNLIESLSYREKCEKLIMSTDEAEAVKLFANTYLATRVAFFNEVSTFALKNDIRADAVISGMGLDPRIGNYYNSPSFGFGGYCLPKDSLQCGELFQEDESVLIKNLPKANETRKDFIVNRILKKGYKTVGIDRLVMKPGSDNLRESASIDIAKKLLACGIVVYAYEPMLEENFDGIILINDYKEFQQKSEIVISNNNIQGF